VLPLNFFAIQTLIDRWWKEELSLLKEASTESYKSWKAAAKPQTGPILTDGKPVGGNIVGVLRNMKSAVLSVTPTSCTKLCYRKITQTSGSAGTLYKFESSNKCNQVEGGVRS